MITVYTVIGLILTIAILLGIKLMNSPKTAVLGNLIGSISMFCAIILTLVYNNIINEFLLWVALIIGGVLGVVLAVKVSMVQMPQMVALLNGLGGASSAIVALIILFNNYGDLNLVSRLSSGLALMIGAITFSGSLIAVAKLSGKMKQQPIVFQSHTFLNTISICFIIFSIVIITLPNISKVIHYTFSLMIFLVSIFYGVMFSIRVGGADMPITISLLNSFSGLAASIAGFALFDPLLVVIGAIVGASGLILTQIMCKAMNRSLRDVITGRTLVLKGDKIIQNVYLNKENNSQESKIFIVSEFDEVQVKVIESLISQILEEAQSVMIVPGYGMALAQAQYIIKELYDKFVSVGKEVNFAIHPVAGRMPGHMNVLLAEVGIPYDKLLELDESNAKLSKTDLVIVVGANDVINPAANTAEGTPIYGMPILEVKKAKNIFICNKDTKPGYAGVENPLYNDEHVILLLGDAKDSIKIIIDSF
ncbi:MAG: NAD(P)(+) transhydrogenase (Re/Si-specific) subunit beta [Defluviitoga tunisiensis]